MQRLFVAIWPSESAIAAARAHLTCVRPRHPDLRWQPEERWHVTLAFLGARDPDHAGQALDRALARRLPAPTAIRLTGAGTFGPVLWLGVEHGEWLGDLARGLQHDLHVDDTRFHAHLTIARGRGPGARQLASSAMPDLDGHVGPWWTPCEVTLVASVTGPNPSYSVLRSWSLPAADPGSAGRADP